jgi:hypothetical protein
MYIYTKVSFPLNFETRSRKLGEEDGHLPSRNVNSPLRLPFNKYPTYDHEFLSTDAWEKVTALIYLGSISLWTQRMGRGV